MTVIKDTEFAKEYEGLKRHNRRVGLTAELPEEWVEAVRDAKVADAFDHLDQELKEDVEKGAHRSAF